MATTLQIRNVPDDVHSAVRARAALAGVSVSDYLLGLVGDVVTRPTMAEVVTRARQLALAGGGTDRDEAVTAVREGRDE